MVDLNSMRTCVLGWTLVAAWPRPTARDTNETITDIIMLHTQNEISRYFFSFACSVKSIGRLTAYKHKHTHQTFYFIFPSLDVSLFRIRPRHLYGCWLFEAEINLESEMDLRLPNFREILVFHSVHKTFPL